MASHEREAIPVLPGSPGTGMRFVTVYLSGYYLLLIAALVSLWYGGVLGRLPTGWVLIGLVIAVGLGAAVFFTSGKTVTRD